MRNTKTDYVIELSIGNGHRASLNALEKFCKQNGGDRKGYVCHNGKPLTEYVVVSFSEAAAAKLPGQSHFIALLPVPGDHLNFGPLEDFTVQTRRLTQKEQAAIGFPTPR
ncbi:MAG: hypothetical protein H6853_08950 [Rhodospirillales bacterium]|nr:hypothetical protein [Alphaproteobacteria bacterium]USO03632.1 MAG: hypothetical protein H6853_08950 [Rhodospirillales bacterium]